MWVKGLTFKISFFMWKMWRRKLPLDDIIRRMGYFAISRYWCYVNPQEETMTHVLFTSAAAKRTWSYFYFHVGFSLEGFTLQQAVVRSWTAHVILRHKSVFQALPSIIVWELWKRRNNYKYGDVVTISRVIYHVSSTLQALVKVRKPGIQNIPHKWPDLLDMMEQYTPRLKLSRYYGSFLVNDG